MRALLPRGRGARGFTLIEIMVVVVVLAVLAVLVLPSFFRESMQKQYDSEVSAVFAELMIKEEQYKMEHGTYLAVAQCPAGAPVANNGPGVDLIANCLAPGQAWCLTGPTCLNATPGQTSVRCVYQVFAGPPPSFAPPPPAGFTLNGGQAPIGQWWYAIATCDIDGKGGTDTQYMTGYNNNVATGGHGFQTLNYGQ